MVKLMVGMVALALASTAIAGEVQKKSVQIPSVKAGKCSITLLNADGVKPLAGAKLTLQSVEDTKLIISAEAAKSGLCVVDVKNGRYILSVNDKIMTLFDVADDGKLAWCRIVVSEKPMLVGDRLKSLKPAVVDLHLWVLMAGLLLPLLLQPVLLVLPVLLSAVIMLIGGMSTVLMTAVMMTMIHLLRLRKKHRLLHLVLLRPVDSFRYI